MLKIKELKVAVTDSEDAEILHGLNLTVNHGEVHAIMGPNGSGKSTLANAIAGSPYYTVTQGDILLDGESIVEDPPDARAHKGVFLAFQYPSEIPGVRHWQFLKAAHDAKQNALGQPKMSVREFSKLFDETVKKLEFPPDLMKRSLNDGFSGGEKKRNEVLQMSILQPRLAVLDETDSGLDVDALRIVAKGVNALRAPDRSFILVTHYNRILRYIMPDKVHILVNGKIVKSGGKDLATLVEENGYESFVKEGIVS